MEENQDIEFQDTSSFDEEAIQEPEIETTNDEVDIEALKAEAEKAAEYKKYADRVAAENKELKKKSSEPTINQSSSDSDERFERLELKTEGYSSDEVDYLMRNGGKTALSDKYTMAAIESMRRAAKSKDATPTGTGKSPIYQKFTEKDLKNLPLEELEKIIPQN